MSDAFLPDLPYGIRVRRAPFFTNTIQSAAAGRELRYGRQDAVRYRYTYEAEGLVTDPTNQVQALLDHFITHRGRRESFLLVDPLDGVTRRVRFDQDELPCEQIVSSVWLVEPFELVSVLGA